MVDYNLSSLTHGTIDLVPEVPKASADLLMQNSKANYAEGRYGKLILQHVELNEFSVHYNIYDIQNRFSLDINCNDPVLMIHLALENDLQYSLKGIGDVYLKEGQFNILYLPSVDGTALFEHAGVYRAFRIYLPAEALTQYAEIFPYINEFLDHIAAGEPALLLKEQGWISSEIRYIITQFIQCTYEEAVRRLYYDSLIKELLLILLLQKQNNHLNGKRYMQSMDEARSIIQKNISQNFTIPEVAQQVGLNPSKLRVGFKQAFGIRISEFMVAVKMQKAFAMILETDIPLKEIARLTGYTSVENFITAFKNHFDTTPASLRKK